jgi:hypothetical protein
MTYPPSPVNEPTFIVITSAGLLALLAAAVLTLLQPSEIVPSVTAVQTIDVSTTGTVVASAAGACEATDPARLVTAAGADGVSLAPAAD